MPHINLNGPSTSPTRTTGFPSLYNPPTTSDNAASSSSASSSGSSSPLTSSGEFGYGSSFSGQSSPRISLDGPYVSATIRLLVVNDDSSFWSSDNIDQSVTIRLSIEQARRIHDIHALSPSIEQAIASLRLKKDYHYPRYITFTQHDSFKGDTHLNTVAHAPSLKAWMNILRDAKVGNKLPPNSPLHTLSAITIDDSRQAFRASGAVAQFNNLLDEIRASEVPLIHFPKLNSIQALVASKSDDILISYSVLLKKSCLTQIKDFNLQFTQQCQPFKSQNETLYFGDHKLTQAYLDGVYYCGLQHSEFSQLSHMNIVLWGDTDSAENALAAQKDSLTSLIVDDIFSDKEVRNATSDMVSRYRIMPSGDLRLQYDYKETTPPTFVDNTNPKQPALYDILQKYLPQMQLQQFQLNRFGALGELPSIDLGFTIHAIYQGFLRNLNKISFVMPQDFRKYSQVPIDPSIAMDIEAYRQAHLGAITAGKMPAIEEMKLLFPEKTGYEGLLTDLAEGRLPYVKKITYLIPPQYIGEDAWNYEVRVGALLSKIYSAIHEKKAPIETVLIEGFIPQSLQDLARSLEAMVGCDF